MIKSKIILLMGILSISINLSLTGCTNGKEELNQSLIITDDVKKDSEPELKVISTEEFKFEDPIKSLNAKFIEKDKDSILIRVTAGDTVGKSILTKIKGNVVVNEEEKVITDDGNLGVGKSFYVESLNDNKALVTNWYNNEKFEVEKSLLSNENSRYILLEDYLIEFVDGASWNNFTTSSIAWNKLTDGTNGIVKMPEDLDSALYASVIGDRLLVATTTISSAEGFYSKLQSSSEAIGYLLPEILLVIDLTNNEVIEKVTIGSFRDFKVVDSERIIFTLGKENEEVIEMYNLNNKTRKELMKYSTVPGEGLIIFNGLEVFPSRDKIYYCEDNGKMLSLKIAEINGMEIENVITAYEAEKNDAENFLASDISIGIDEREIKIFNRALIDGINQIDKLIKIKLSK